VWSGFPDKEVEDQVLRDIDKITTADVDAVTDAAEITRLQQEVRAVHVDDGIRQYIIEVANRLRQHPEVLAGPGPRGSIAIFRGARALAYIQGRDYVIPDDVKGQLITAFHHRIHLSAEAEMDGVTPDAIIKEIAAAVPVPRVQQ